MVKRKIKPLKGELNITSMMDMFTIVLVFLLKNFATEGNLMTSADNLILPKSANSPGETGRRKRVHHDGPHR